jgi:multiple sugar transport system permease protein
MEKKMETRHASPGRAGKIAARTVAYILVTALCLVMVFPVYWLVITAVKVGNDASASPPIFIPLRVTAENLLNVFVKQGIGLNLFNSVVVTALSVFFLVLIGSMAAYALSKPVLSRRTTKGILIWILVTRIFPPVTTVIPFFMIIKTIGLIDTRASLVLTYVSYGLPFAIWLMLGFFQELPKEIEEAALVEGYTLSQRFFHILLPLTLPGIAVTAIFMFIYSWNEFMFATTLTTLRAKTLPVVISTFMSDKYLDWGSMATMGTLMIVPIILFSLFSQKYLVRGLTFGAVKG